MTDAGRAKRRPPKRKGPIRNATTQAAVEPKVNGEDTPLDEAVADAIAHAVRLGYQVLAENLEEGRAAAKQFKVGEYGLSDVPSDLNQLATRMVRLARDLSSTTFDLADRALQDPGLREAVRRLTIDPGSKDPKKPAPKSQSVKPAPSPASVASAPSPLIPISCSFTGDSKAAVLTAWLMRPPAPATLTTSGLTTLSGTTPAITDIKIKPTSDGLGVTANIAIPKGLPSGLYSGAIVTADTEIALGTLTIQVSA